MDTRTRIATTTPPGALSRRGDPVRIGMPHLCRRGLSENWLWKAAGHEHWMALAQAYQLDRPEFRTAAGDRLYPAFTHITCNGAGLAGVVEDEIAVPFTRMERISRTRFRSRVSLRIGMREVACLAMESAFLRRRVAEANLSVVRDCMARECILPVPGRAQAGGDPFTDVDFDAPDTRALSSLVLDPDPWNDFNGADFLYFATFQAMLDRCEWQWLRSSRPPVTRRRQIALHGNIELGDRVLAEGCARTGPHGGLQVLARLRRSSDGKIIARALTERTPCEA